MSRRDDYGSRLLRRRRLAAAVASVLGLLLIAILPAPARAQDTFVPLGLKSTCEWLSGETCVRRRERVKPRIVHVPVTRPYRVVPEHLEPLKPRRREIEVRGWRDWRDRDRDRDTYLRAGSRCWPVKIKAYSDEKIARDAKTEAMRRWSGIVRSELGELFMDWKNAAERAENCWQSSTGERALDKMTGAIIGGHERCMVEARPCRADKPKPDEVEE